MELKDKVALVLGAIKGIGKSIGLALADEGARVALNYFDWEENLEDMRRDFSRSGCDHLILKTDLLDSDAIQGMVEKVIQHYGRLDVLINNIERGGWPIVHGPYTQDQWDLEIETTLRAKRWVFDAALPHLIRSGCGVVVNFSSIAGIVGRSGPASAVFNEGYSAANRSVSLLTETWARLAAPEVRVNEIMLGFIDTRHGPGTRGWDLLSQENIDEIVGHTLLRRIGTVGDVVKTVLFIVKEATFMTGSVVRIDGGYVLGGERIGPMPEGVL